MSNLPPLPAGFVLEPTQTRATPPLPPGFELETNEDSKFGGAAMNATAGANETLYSIAGAPVDIVRGAMNLAGRGINAVTGSNLPQIPEDSFGGSRSIAKMAGAIRPELDPANTEATTTGERVARGAGAGVAGTILPAAAVGAAVRGGAQVSPLVQAVAGRSNSVRAVGADAVAGAAGGAAASAAMEATPDKYDPLSGTAGGIVGGGLGALATGIRGLVRETARAGGDFLAPLTQGGRERMAGQQINDAATDPSALREALANRQAEIVPGSKPTTGQMSGDMGVLALERAAQSRSPEQFQQRRADQNAARRETMESVQSGGAAENVTKALRDRLRQIETEADGDVQMTANTARARNEAVGQSMRPEDAGDVLRENLTRRRNLAMEKERRLWNAVDPDGSLALPAANTTRVARDTATNIPASAKPPSGEEAAIYEVLGRYGDVVPFGELTALRSRVSTAMADERGRHGKSPTWARMSELRGAIERDIDEAVTTKVQRETEAVAAGTMRVEDTVEAYLLREQQRWVSERAEQAAGGVSPTGFAGSAGGGSRSVPGSYRAEGTPGRGPGTPPRDPRLSPDDLQPNFDRAAQERLNRATEATRQRADTFDGRQLGPMLARPADHASYNMESARVASRAFTPGAAGFERMQAVRRALGPNSRKAMAAIESYAIDSMRKAAMGDDGVLDAAKVDRWRRAHSDALRAFPELDIRIQDAASASETAAQFATARKAAVDDAQRGAIGRLIGVEDPQDVSRIVGGLFGRQDSVQQLGQLRRAIGNDQEALQGLRRATADFLSSRLMTNTEAATSGQTLISADQMQTFVRQNKAALRTVFSGDEVTTLEAVAADLQRANRSLTAVRIPGQSNTVQDALAVTSGDTSTSILGKLMAASMASGGALAGLGVQGGGTGAVLGAGAGALIGALRQSGIQRVNELVTDALLNPNRARMLLAKVPANNAKRESDMMASLARRYARAAVASAAVADGSGDTQRPREMLQVDVPVRRPASLQETLADRGTPMRQPSRLEEAMMMRGGR